MFFRGLWQIGGFLAQGFAPRIGQAMSFALMVYCFVVFVRRQRVLPPGAGQRAAPKTEDTQCYLYCWYFL